MWFFKRVYKTTTQRWERVVFEKPFSFIIITEKEREWNSALSRGVSGRPDNCAQSHYLYLYCVCVGLYIMFNMLYTNRRETVWIQVSTTWHKHAGPDVLAAGHYQPVPCLIADQWKFFFFCVCVCVFLLFVDCLNFLMAILKKKSKKKKIKLSFYGGKMGGNSNEKMKDLK